MLSSIMLTFWIYQSVLSTEKIYRCLFLPPDMNSRKAGGISYLSLYPLLIFEMINDQSWVFIGRTDAEAETPILWPPDVKNWLIWKDPDAGKDWGQEEETTEDEMVGWHHRCNGHGFGWTPGAGDGQESWHSAVHGVAVGHDWATELNWMNVAWSSYQSERMPDQSPETPWCTYYMSLNYWRDPGGFMGENIVVRGARVTW